MDCNEIICINDWQPDESYEHGYYPEGTRDKYVYFSPTTTSAPLRPNYRYMLKESRRRTPWQFWMEVMAYRIGQVIGVAVPPTYIGKRSRGSAKEPVWGALIEWFYTDDEQYTDGGRLIGPLIPDFDYKTGEQHNLQTSFSCLEFMKATNSSAIQKEMANYWANILTFDVLIGNTDRHQENWGIIMHKSAFVLSSQDELTVVVRLSPAFDNGTAMAYEQPEEHFAKFDDRQYMLRYLTRPKKARHHMKWSLAETTPMNFYDFMKRFVQEFPETRSAVEQRLNFTETDLRSRLAALTNIPVDAGCRLTQCRLDFTLRLLMERKNLLEEALGEA